MNIGKVLSEGITSIKSNSSLRQILILASLAVIFMGFGNRMGTYPQYGIEGAPDGPEGFSGQNPYGNGETGYGTDNNSKKRKHKHRHRDRDKKVYDHITEVQYNNDQPNTDEAVNPSEVPYTVE